MTDKHEIDRLMEEFYEQCDFTWVAVAAFAGRIAKATRADERKRLREQVKAYERAALYGHTREAYRRVIDLLGGESDG